MSQATPSVDGGHHRHHRRGNRKTQQCVIYEQILYLRIKVDHPEDAREKHILGKYLELEEHLENSLP